LERVPSEAYKVIRKEIAPVEEDRIMYTDMNKLDEMVKAEVLIKAVENIVGELE